MMRPRRARAAAISWTRGTSSWSVSWTSTGRDEVQARRAGVVIAQGASPGSSAERGSVAASAEPHWGDISVRTPTMLLTSAWIVSRAIPHDQRQQLGEPDPGAGIDSYARPGARDA